MAHGAVPLDAADHEGLHIHHAGAAGRHGNNVEALANQTVTGYKGGVLTLGEGAGLTGLGGGEEEEQQEGEGQGAEPGGEHGGRS